MESADSPEHLRRRVAQGKRRRQELDTEVKDIKRRLQVAQGVKQKEAKHQEILQCIGKDPDRRPRYVPHGSAKLRWHDEKTSLSKEHIKFHGFMVLAKDISVVDLQYVSNFPPSDAIVTKAEEQTFLEPTRENKPKTPDEVSRIKKWRDFLTNYLWELFETCDICFKRYLEELTIHLTSLLFSSTTTTHSEFARNNLNRPRENVSSPKADSRMGIKPPTEPIASPSIDGTESSAWADKSATTPLYNSGDGASRIEVIRRMPPAPAATLGRDGRQFFTQRYDAVYGVQVSPSQVPGELSSLPSRSSNVSGQYSSGAQLHGVMTQRLSLTIPEVMSKPILPVEPNLLPLHSLSEPALPAPPAPPASRLLDICCEPSAGFLFEFMEHKRRDAATQLRYVIIQPTADGLRQLELGKNLQQIIPTGIEWEHVVGAAPGVIEQPGWIGFRTRPPTNTYQKYWLSITWERGFSRSIGGIQRVAQNGDLLLAFPLDMNYGLDIMHTMGGYQPPQIMQLP